MLLLCGLSVALAYWSVLGAYWVSDDMVNVHGQSMAHSWLDMFRFPEGAPFYRPLFVLSLLVDRVLFGPSPLAFRLHSVLQHTLTAWLLAILVTRGTRSRAAGLCAGLFFAASPLHPEAVSWIAARNYTQAAFYGALAAVAAHAYLRGSRIALFGAAIAYGLGLLAAEAVIPLCLCVPLAVLAFGPVPKRRFWKLVGVLALALGAYLAMRSYALGGLGGYRSADGASLHARIDVARILTYVQNAVLHTVAPGPWDGGDGPWVTVAVGVAGGANLALLAAAPWNRRTVWPSTLVVGAWLLALSMGATWGRLTPDLIGTRLLYLPHVIACGGAGWLAGAAWQLGGWRRGLVAVAVTLIVVTQIALTRTVNGWWAHGGSLVQAAIDDIDERVSATGARTILLHGMPPKHRGAEVAARGLEAGIALRLGQIAVQQIPDAARWAEIVAMRRQAEPDLAALVLIGEWDATKPGWRWL